MCKACEWPDTGELCEKCQKIKAEIEAVEEYYCECPECEAHFLGVPDETLCPECGKDFAEPREI